FQEGKAWTLRGIEAAEQLSDMNDLAYFHIQLGAAEYYLGYLQKSSNCYEKAMAIFQDLGDQGGIVKCELNLGVNYYQLGLFTDALRMFFRVRDHQEDNGLNYFLPSIHLNIAETYLELEEREKAMESYQASIAAARTLGKRQVEGKAMSGLGRYYLSVDSLDQAYEYASRGLEIHQALNFEKGIAEARGILAEIFLATKKYTKAIERSEQSYAWASAKGNVSLAQATARILSEAQEGLGNYSQSLFWFKDYQRLQDSLLSAEKIRNASQLSARIEFERAQERMALEQKNREDLAKAEVERQILLRNLLLIGLAVMVLIALGAVFAYRRIRHINTNMARQRKEILFLNQNLERLVAERTQEIEEKNAQLSDYIFTNSHRVRGPIARILGLIQLREAGQFNAPEEQDQLFAYIHKAAKEADGVVLEIGKNLETEA
ncbi:MAG: hypothetical protein AAF570_12600, partial [Bacteroidota bacterium]